VVGLPRARSVATGIGFSCALSREGEVHCWGKSPHGPGSAGAAAPDPTVRRVEGLPKLHRLVASKGYACGFTATGEAHCFFGVEYELSRTRQVHRVSALDSARELILPEMGFTNYAAVVSASGQLLVGPSPAFDSLEKLQLSPVAGFEKTRRIASSYSRLYVQLESGAVSRLQIRDGKVSGKPTPLASAEGTTSLGGDGTFLLSKGAVLVESDGKTTTLRERSDWTRLLDGPGPCGVTREGSVTCWERRTRADRLLAKDVKQVERSSAHRTHTCLVDGQGGVHCLEDCSYGQCGVNVGLFMTTTPVKVALP
jgi:hypothetical protein